MKLDEFFTEPRDSVRLAIFISKNKIKPHSIKLNVSIIFQYTYPNYKPANQINELKKYFQVYSRFHIMMYYFGTSNCSFGVVMLI
jgi:hypothetical protein